MIQAAARPFQQLYKNRELIFDYVKREIFGRYKGSPLGAVWSIVHPAVFALVYIFLFGIVFQSNIGFTEDMPLGYVSYILSGLVPWLCIQSCLNGSALVIVYNQNIVKQVIFPLEVFPVQAVGSALFIQTIYLGVTILYNTVDSLLRGGPVFWSLLLLPVVLLVQITFLLGLSFLISSVTVFFRDLKEIIQIIGVIGIYLMPVVYLPSAVPSIFKIIIYLNPFSYIIWMFQDVLYFGQILHPGAWIVSTIMAIVAFYGGYTVFQKLKPYFGSVL